ncbi:pirin family protein [Trabulsiella odontotermitis]|uniref:pirin family protein n=1 Tax=Trabulsiella odontotermitis TaxID=379893 RepID=UPI0006BA1CAA|nr:pirin family protein [Trabulsiella odontotermitis]
MTTRYRVKKANDLHYLPASDFHPADTYFHFSFSNYYDPDNMHYGVLRVVNDDNVKPRHGFDRHPHKNMEIVSYVIDGKLTHWDSATREEDILARGHVQTITAGSGVWHSELNNQDDWCRFLQIWIVPSSNGLAVRYNNHKFTEEDRKNKLLHIVGSLKNDNAPLSLNQDVNMYVSEMTDPAAEVKFKLKKGRQAYINNFEGSVQVDGIATLAELDTLEIAGPASLTFRTTDDHSHFIVIEMPEYTS